jgi:hypothetical protein
MDESSGKINNQVADCRLDNDGEGPEARTGILHAVTYIYIYTYTLCITECRTRRFYTANLEQVASSDISLAELCQQTPGSNPALNSCSFGWLFFSFSSAFIGHCLQVVLNQTTANSFQTKSLEQSYCADNTVVCQVFVIYSRFMDV